MGWAELWVVQGRAALPAGRLQPPAGSVLSRRAGRCLHSGQEHDYTTEQSELPLRTLVLKVAVLGSRGATVRAWPASWGEEPPWPGAAWQPSLFLDVHKQLDAAAFRQATCTACPCVLGTHS